MTDNQRIILLRYGELHLKGRNRKFFENLLVANIKRAISGFSCRFEQTYSRYFVGDYAIEDEGALVAALKKVFGLHSLSVASCVKSDLDQIADACIAHARKEGAFRINCNRADKTFPLDSVEVCKELGYRVLCSNALLRVDLHKPDFAINVDIRENGVTYIFDETIKGAGGMPVGSAGQGLLMLSGGIDSPVAGYLMARRGLALKAIHFYSPPYTSEQAKQKAEDLARQLVPYTGTIELYNIPFTHIQEQIHKSCAESFMVILMRRFMMRISNIIAAGNACKTVITGESLGQVASQTLESITATNAVSELPVMRPLIGLDKDDIIEISRAIDTYDISIRPFDDCCTVFLPDNPQTRPKIERVLFEEGKLDVDTLIRQALDGLTKVAVE